MTFDGANERRRVRLGGLALAVAALALAACSTPILAVDDAVRFEDGQARFVAFAQKKTGWVLRGVPDVEVEFRVEGEHVATEVTDERGFVKVVTKVEAEADEFEARASFLGEDFSTDGQLHQWRSDRVVVACDIDSTISHTSLGALFFDDEDATSTPIEGSVEALQQMDADHQILYITARPRFSLEKTRAWLDEHGYPPEPVITSLTIGDALSQSEYKTRTIKSLRKHYKNIVVGIGNTDIDAKSYGAHGMLAILVQPDQEVGREGHVIHFQTWEQISEFFRENRELLMDPERVKIAAKGGETLVIPGME